MERRRFGMREEKSHCGRGRGWACRGKERCRQLGRRLFILPILKLKDRMQEMYARTTHLYETKTCFPIEIQWYWINIGRDGRKMEYRIKENILIFHHFSCLFFSISVIILSSSSFYFKDIVWLTDVSHVLTSSYVIFSVYRSGSSDIWYGLTERNGQQVSSHSINSLSFTKSIILKWTYIAKGHNKFIFWKFKILIWTCMDPSDECNHSIPSYSHKNFIHSNKLKCIESSYP